MKGIEHGHRFIVLDMKSNPVRYIVEKVLLDNIFNRKLRKQIKSSVKFFDKEFENELVRKGNVSLRK